MKSGLVEEALTIYTTKAIAVTIKIISGKGSELKIEAKMRLKMKNAWNSMKQRCLNPDNPSYPNYGGRGISIFESWIKDYDLFSAHVGCPVDFGLSIDRIDVNGNYEPGNLRWATKQEQALNKRKNPETSRIVDGVLMSTADMAREFGINHATIAAMLRRGMTPE